jgi:hypothetical protein
LIISFMSNQWEAVALAACRLSQARSAEPQQIMQRTSLTVSRRGPLFPVRTLPGDNL